MEMLCLMECLGPPKPQKLVEMKLSHKTWSDSGEARGGRSSKKMNHENAQKISSKFRPILAQTSARLIKKSSRYFAVDIGINRFEWPLNYQSHFRNLNKAVAVPSRNGSNSRQTCREPWVHIALDLVPTFCGGRFLFEETVYSLIEVF